MSNHKGTKFNVLFSLVSAKTIGCGFFQGPEIWIFFYPFQGTDTVESNLSVSKEKYFNKNITTTITRPIVEVLVFYYNNYIL